MSPLAGLYILENIIYRLLDVARHLGLMKSVVVETVELVVLEQVIDGQGGGT